MVTGHALRSYSIDFELFIFYGLEYILKFSLSLSPLPISKKNISNKKVKQKTLFHGV